MKKSITILICLAACSLLLSCAQIITSGRLTASIPQNDIFITQDLHDFLKKKQNPTIMLRVPTSVSTVTGSDTKEVKDYNSLYGAIEKVLMQAGFTVRDRGLLNSLLVSGQADYKQIGEKTKTDIIIEITSFTVKEAEKKVAWPELKPTKQKAYEETIDAIEYRIRAYEYVIECKIVIVEEGLTGGMFTFHYGACANTCNFEASFGPVHATYARFINGTWQYVNQSNYAGYGIYALTWDINNEEVAQALGQTLINLMRNN
jgi:hypothetical protein